MRKTILAATLTLGAAVALSGAVFSTTPAQAQGINVEIGRGYHHGWDNDWRWRHRHWRAEAFRHDCRVVVRRMWRHGERVVVRRRICD